MYDISYILSNVTRMTKRAPYAASSWSAAHFAGHGYQVIWTDSAISKTYKLREAIEYRNLT